MRVVLSYIHFPMAIARYFDNALRRRDDVELVTFGPFTGPWIPWGGGMNLPPKYAKSPDIPIGTMGQSGGIAPVPIAVAEASLPWQPDLWIQVDAGFHMTGRPKHGQNFIIATDPHAIDYSDRRRWFDKFFSMQKIYAKPGDEVLPYAYDPGLHFPMPEVGREYDAVLLGLSYQNRVELGRVLQARGLRILTGIGPVFEEYRRLYNAAPVALSWSSKEDLIARVFEGLAMQRLVACNHVPDLPDFFEDGRDLIAFHTVDEAVDKITYHLEHMDELEAIAAQGHKTVKPHTYDARVAQILEAAS